MISDDKAVECAKIIRDYCTGRACEKCVFYDNRNSGRKCSFETIGINSFRFEEVKTWRIVKNGGL